MGNKARPIKRIGLCNERVCYIQSADVLDKNMCRIIMDDKIETHLGLRLDSTYIMW